MKINSENKETITIENNYYFENEMKNSIRVIDNDYLGSIKLCTILTHLVNKCPTKYKLINLGVKSELDDSNHDTTIILEKGDDKINVIFYDPHGYDNDSPYKYAKDLLKNMIKTDPKKKLEFIDIEKTSCPIGIQKYETDIKLGGPGYCMMFNFFFIYCSLIICFKYNLSFSKYSKDIDTELLKLFEINSEYTINKMCNLVEQIFKNYITKEDEFDLFHKIFEINDTWDDPYIFNTIQEIELKETVSEDLQKMFFSKRETLEKYKNGLIEFDKTEYKLQLDELKDKLYNISKSNKKLDEDFHLLTKLIEDSPYNFNRNSTFIYYKTQYLLNRMDNDISFIKIKNVIDSLTIS